MLFVHILFSTWKKCFLMSNLYLVCMYTNVIIVLNACWFYLSQLLLSCTLIKPTFKHFFLLCSLRIFNMASSASLFNSNCHSLYASFWHVLFFLLNCHWDGLAFNVAFGSYEHCLFHSLYWPKCVTLESCFEWFGSENKQDFFLSPEVLPCREFRSMTGALEY